MTYVNCPTLRVKRKRESGVPALSLRRPCRLRCSVPAQTAEPTADAYRSAVRTHSVLTTLEHQFPHQRRARFPKGLRRLRFQKATDPISKRRLDMYKTLASVALSALEKADEIQARGGKRKTAPVRKWFVRSLDGQEPMLSVLYSGSGRGGRSGYISIKVLLSLIWKTSRPPFETRTTAPALAELLNLPDPAGNGARRVRDALRVLATNNLIRLVPRPGTSPVIQLMNETGNGEDYTLPSTSYALSQRTKRAQESVTDPNLYFQLPAELWTEGFFQALKGPGLVMLLILLSEEAHKKPVWFSGSEFTDRYRISPSTRTKGTQELVDLDILVSLEPLFSEIPVARLGRE